MNEGVMRRMTAWCFVVSGAGAALWAAVMLPVPAPGIAPPRPSTPFHASSRPYAADSLARLATSRDVFRSVRRAAAVAYDPQRAAAPVEVNQPPKPTLALLGLVAGSEATAVIEGFPGIEGARVVRVGDVVSGLRVKQIASDRVLIAGMDTTWMLRVREPWKP
jgi:hypothetical protein